jgi:cation:H+ antiporter
MIFLDQRVAAGEARKSLEQTLPVAPQMTLAAAVGRFALCAAAIFVAGPFLASAAGTLADETGLGKTFVGTTLVAISTSLPEFVSSLAALRLGAVDLAVGNVFGSNSFNMLILVPLDFFHPQPLFAVASQSHVMTCMATILATMVVIMGQLYRAESRVRFIEPDAWLVIAIVIGAMALLYYLPH